VARHWKEATLEIALALARLPEAYSDRRRRRHLMEGSFAQAANKHHFKRARWRRLWRQQVQDWLIAAVQNIAILCGGVGSAIRARLPRTPRGPAPPLGGSVGFILRPKTTNCPPLQAFSSPPNRKWTSNQSSQRTLGNRPSTHDPF